MKNRKRKADDPLCPVCNERVADDLNLHVELCLRRSESSNGNRKNGNQSDNDDEDDDDSIDVEGETFEEYEWAGQTRIRASSLLEGGYSAAGWSINQSHHSLLLFMVYFLYFIANCCGMFRFANISD